MSGTTASIGSWAKARPGFGLSALSSAIISGRSSGSTPQALISAGNSACASRSQMVEQGGHRRVEPVAVLQLQGQALLERAREHAGRIEQLQARPAPPRPAPSGQPQRARPPARGPRAGSPPRRRGRSDAGRSGAPAPAGRSTTSCSTRCSRRVLGRLRRASRSLASSPKSVLPPRPNGARPLIARPSSAPFAGRARTSRPRSRRTSRRPARRRGSSRGRRSARRWRRRRRRRPRRRAASASGPAGSGSSWRSSSGFCSSSPST